MSKLGSLLRALTSPAEQHLGTAQGLLGHHSYLQSFLVLVTPPLAAGETPALAVRRLAASTAAASDQGGLSASSKDDLGAERQGASRPSFKDLLQASSQRIAQGEVGRLMDGDGPLGPTAKQLDAALRPQPEQQATAAGPPEPLGMPDLGASGQGADTSGAPAVPESSQRLFHPQYGYAALGGVLPSESGTSAAGLVHMLTAQSPRINPRKRFMPGDTYEPQDLNPFAARAADTSRGRPAAVTRPSVSEVMEKADYKNVAFLARWFLSPAGRLLPRRQTRLPPSVQKHVARQIKLARHMGLMAGEARLDKMHLPRLREQELLEAERRGAGSAAKPNELLDFGA